MKATIELGGLRRRFGPAVALHGIMFTVQPRQVTGIVGPSGVLRGSSGSPSRWGAV